MLFILLNLTGCVTAEKMKGPVKQATEQKSTITAGHTSNNNVRSTGTGMLPQGFEGSWVVQISCDKRHGMRSNTEYGLLEVSKSGRSSFEADFYIFEERKGIGGMSPGGLPLNLSHGSVLKMEGRSQNEGTDIQLNGDKWLLKSNRPEPISFQGSLQKDGFFMKGKVIGDPSCARFVASKFPANNNIEKNPVFSFGQSGLLGRLVKNNRTQLGPQECRKLFDWVGSGELVPVIEKSGLSAPLSVNSLFFDEENFIRHLGKTYRNWTDKDAKAYAMFSVACLRSPDIANNRAYRSHAKIHMIFLEKGKDSPNDYGSHKQQRRTGLFDKFKTEPPNIRWAGHYFVLAVAKSARIHKQSILARLQSLDYSEASIEEIQRYFQYSNFPINFLPANDKKHFKQSVAALHGDRKNKNTEQALVAFNPAQYPKTLHGLKSLLNDSKKLKHAINALADQSKRMELNRRYEAMLEGHSFEASQELINNIPANTLTPEDYIALGRYRGEVKNYEIKYLLEDHQRLVNERLDDAIANFPGEFYPGMDQWIANHVPLNESAIDQLNYLSRLFYTKDIIALAQQSHQLSGAKKQIADKILSEVDLRQDDCDQLAVHPKDKKKPYHIVGVSDALLNQELALEACISSLERQPDHARFNFQLGRVLFLSQLYDDARTYLEEAAQNGYTPAYYYLGMMQLEAYAGFDANIEKAVALFEESAKDGFSPAIAFVESYRRNLAAIKREEERIANATYEHPKLVNSFITGELDPLLPYSPSMLYTAGMLKNLHEWCPDLVSANDVRRTSGYLKSPNAGGYLQYVDNNTTKFGLKFFDDIVLLAEKKSHPNDNYDEETLEFNTSSDVFTLIQKYRCFGVETENFAKNALRYMDTAPPYNLTSQPFWDACVNSASGKISTSKSQFCGCFLSTARGGRASHQGFRNIFGLKSERYFDHASANKLLRNFWSMANKAMQNISVLKRCANPDQGLPDGGASQQFLEGIQGIMGR